MTASAMVRPTSWKREEIRTNLLSNAIVHREQIGRSLLEFLPEPLLRDDANHGLLQSIRVIVQDGHPLPSRTKVTVADTARTSVPSRIIQGPDANSIRLLIGCNPAPRPVDVRFPELAEQAVRLVIEPPRKWTIHFIRHTHLDIGYTDLQNTVIGEHLAFLDASMDLTEATDGFPEDARFRWCVEALWSFDQWRIARPPRRVAQFLARVREGRIELTAMPFNLDTETCSTDKLHELLRPAMEIQSHYGVHISTAMQTDAPGAVVGLPDALASRHVRYLSVAHNWAGRSTPHLVGGKDLPRLFRWKAPSGRQVLVWITDSSNGMAYMEGNLLGFSDDYKLVDDCFPAFLSALSRSAYPYGEVSWGYRGSLIDPSRKPYPWDILHLRVQGQFSDNAPPNIALSETVARWNNAWTWPHIRISRNEDFFRDTEERYGASVEVHTGDWSDWWSDGVGSGAHPQAIVRQAQASLRDGLTLATLSAAFPDTEVKRVVDHGSRAYEHISLFNEHTWGASDPVTDGDQGGASGKMQWHWTFAQALSAEAASASLQEQARARLSNRLGTSRGALCSAYIVNSCSWRRTDRASIFVPSNRIPVDVPITLVDSRNGQPLLFDAHIEDKRSRTSGRTVSVIVDDVPPCRIARLDLIPGDASGAPTPQSPSEPQSENPFRLENDYLAVEVDQKRSCITSLIVRKTGRESVNDNNPLGLNGYIYDRYTVGGTNHASGMVVADVGMLDFLGEWTAAGPAALVESCSEVTAERLTFEYGAAGARRVRTTLTLPRGVPRLDIENRNSKASTLVEEGAYLAFAFKLVDPKTRYELTGGMGGTGLPVVPGAAKHMRAVRRWVSFEEEDLVIGWATQDAPLIELSTVALPYAPFPGTSPEREPGSVYSWVHNNIWDTNFPAEQGFDASFRYSVGVGAGTGPTVGMHTPAGLGHPLIAVLGTAGSPTVLQEWSLLNINDGRVRVTGLTTPAPGEVLVRLQSFAEEGVELRLELGVPVEGAWTANYLAERGEAFEVRERGIRLTIPAMASPAVLVRLPDP